MNIILIESGMSNKNRKTLNLRVPFSLRGKLGHQAAIAPARALRIEKLTTIYVGPPLAALPRIGRRFKNSPNIQQSAERLQMSFPLGRASLSLINSRAILGNRASASPTSYSESRVRPDGRTQKSGGSFETPAWKKFRRAFLGTTAAK